MFMGDSGSMLIGLVLAGSALTLTANFPIDVVGETTQASLLPVLLPVLLPISILVLPFLDLLLAIARRTRKGLSPFSPDKQHLHHRLLELGHSHRRAVAIMWLWAALISLGGTAVAVYQNRVAFLALAGWLVVTVVLTVVVPRVEHPGWTHHDDDVSPPPRR